MFYRVRPLNTFSTGIYRLQRSSGRNGFPCRKTKWTDRLQNIGRSNPSHRQRPKSRTIDRNRPSIYTERRRLGPIVLTLYFFWKLLLIDTANRNKAFETIRIMLRFSLSLSQSIRACRTEYTIQNTATLAVFELFFRVYARHGPLSEPRDRHSHDSLSVIILLTFPSVHHET